MLEIYNKNDGSFPVGNLENGIIPAEHKLTITVEELAQQLNVSRATAYNLARREDFYPAFRIGHRLIVSREALNRWLDEQTEVSS